MLQNVASGKEDKGWIFYFERDPESAPQRLIHFPLKHNFPQKSTI